MKEAFASLTSRGQLTLPVAGRRALGLRPCDSVAFTIDGTDVRLAPARFTLETVLGSIEPLPATSTDNFDDQIHDAVEERAARIRHSLTEQ